MSHTSQTLPEPPPPKADFSGDPLLAHIVNENAKQDEELALTLLVGGTLMSGTLISAETYWTAMYGRDDSTSSSGYENVVPDPLGADAPATDRNPPPAIQPTRHRGTCTCTCRTWC